jgi:methionyl-tRNA formyltransferase
VQLLKIEDPNAVEQPQLKDCENGTIYYKKGESVLFVKCVDSWLPVSRLRIQDKKDVGCADFDNGYQLKLSDMFGNLAIT